MRPNYLPNPGKNHKNLPKFVNFHRIEPKFGGLVGLSCSFPVINVSPLGLDGSLDPGPKPGADVLDFIPGYMGPDLVDGGLEVLGIEVLLDIEHRFDICPYQIVQGIEVRGAESPNVFLARNRGAPRASSGPRLGYDRGPCPASGPHSLCNRSWPGSNGTHEAVGSAPGTPWPPS